jgi:nucleotidyltransferase substrate binding protein (TIGR01987 family)
MGSDTILMSELDIRWRQRIANYSNALEQLGSAVATSQQRPLSELEKQGLIQAFEFTHELAWNVMKDYFAFQGNPGITGSRDAAREAFEKGLIEDGEGWMEMIRSRNQTSHTYQQKIADEIAGHIVARYFPLFEQFLRKMDSLKVAS